MRHVVTLCAIFLLLSVNRHVEAQYFSEGGGGGPWASQKQHEQRAIPEPRETGESLVNIVDELKALRNYQQQQYDDEQLLYNPAQFGGSENFEQAQPFQQQYFESEQPQQKLQQQSELELTNSEELAKIGADLQNLLKQQGGNIEAIQQEDAFPKQNGQPEQNILGLGDDKQAPVDPKKRGQNEFVEFVEPHASKVLKNVESLNKRAPLSEINSQGGSLPAYYSSNNVLFIVGVTMCSVCVVAGVVGGAYHINTIRKQRNEAFDDFTRYSPAGPGRDMLRKGRQFAGSPITDYAGGDDALAKAAHLHHYEQTKQKIIGSDNGIANDDHSDKSDDEADDLEEHNFSIYECPGLAMSGDLEVKNPNFEQQHP